MSECKHYSASQVWVSDGMGDVMQVDLCDDCDEIIEYKPTEASPTAESPEFTCPSEWSQGRIICHRSPTDDGVNYECEECGIKLTGPNTPVLSEVDLLKK